MVSTKLKVVYSLHSCTYQEHHRRAGFHDRGDVAAEVQNQIPTTPPAPSGAKIHIVQYGGEYVNRREKKGCCLTCTAAPAAVPCPFRSGRAAAVCVGEGGMAGGGKRMKEGPTECSVQPCIGLDTESWSMHT
eukprot:SAG11_NODE_364_length_10159_cov_8.232604_1_plen_132_part_00